jgi:hypothetical protein
MGNFSLGGLGAAVATGFNDAISTGINSVKSLNVDNVIDAAKAGGEAAKRGLYSGYNNAKNLAENTGDAIADYWEENSPGWDGRWSDLVTPDGVQPKRSLQGKANSDNTLFAFSTFDPNASLKGGQLDPELSNVGASPRRFLYTQDADSVSYTTNDDKTITLGKRPYSVFNKYSLVNYRGTPLMPEGSSAENKSKHYHKVNMESLSNPTASKIIEETQKDKNNIGYRYNYADFALGKYYGKVSNNMMITLRRFAYPAPDDIISPKAPDAKGRPTELSQPDIARAITWMGGPTGNELSEILKFSHGFSWKKAESEFQTMQSKQGARAGQLGAAISGNRFLASAAAAANGEDAYASMVRRANAGFDAFSNTYPNHVFGPLNVIKETMVREQGLTFDNEFTLKFQYKLKELGGANSKILMLDQLSNILALTYNNAPFWGGDFRYVSDGSVVKPLGNIQHIRSGHFGKFLNSVWTDFGKAYPGASNGGGNMIDNLLKGDFNAIGDSLKAGAGKAFERMAGSSLLKLLNTPQGGYAIKALLTGDPTGQWHVTVGNPLNPIMVIGNLICTSTNVTFEGALGPNDFPEIMTVTVSLKPGMPRDKAGIESMFNAGRGRFYVQPADVADINNTYDVSAYGNKDRSVSANSMYTNTFRKLTNG